MTFDSSKHHRRSLRLRGYDYAQEGAYAVTVCVHLRECLLGEVTSDGIMLLNPLGAIVEEEWLRASRVRPYIDLDAFVVMPNHFHGIIVITDTKKTNVPAGAKNEANEDVGAPEKEDAARGIVGARKDEYEAKGMVGATRRVAPTTNDRPHGPKPGSLGAIIGQFKSIVTKRINILRDTPAAPVWQRSFYDSIIRDEAMLNAYRFYIEHNPEQWAADRYNPVNTLNEKP